MKYLKYIIFLPVCLFVVNCVQQIPPVAPTKSDTYYDTRNQDDDDRDEILRLAIEAGGKACSTDDDCRDDCRDIYSRRKEKNECEELSITQVDRLKTIYETLEDPDEDDLLEIDVTKNGDFDIFINIDIKPLHDAVGKYKKGEAGDVLAWIAKHTEVATIFSKEDNDYEVLSRLLKKLDSNTFTALGTRIESRKNFMDLAVVASNEAALEWIFEYIEETDNDCKESDDSNREDCLESYCGLAEDMDEDNADGLLDYDFFSGLIEDFIEDGINGDDDTSNGDDRPGSGKAWDADPGSDSRFEDIDDLNEWWTDLC